jgi:glycerophosphoryl diester phosphodiesterase
MALLNIAHRGYTRVFPDNTCEALQAAIDAGFDGVEFDVRETADHRFVIYHDPELQDRDIRKWTFHEIEKVKLNDRYAIPSLEQVLDLCRGRVKLVIELKQITSFDSLFSILNERTRLDDIIVASFKRRLVKPFSILSPRIRTGFIVALPLSNLVRRAQSAGCFSLIARFPIIDRKLVEKAHSDNLDIFVWGCRDMTELRKAVEFPVRGIISDFPELLRELLGESA